MSVDVKEIMKFLFPEYQIKACVDERGFISKNQQGNNYAKTLKQNINQGNVQQQTAPSVSAEVSVIKPAHSSLSQPQTKNYTPTKDTEKVVNRANDIFEILPT